MSISCVTFLLEYYEEIKENNKRGGGGNNKFMSYLNTVAAFLIEKGDDKDDGE